MLAIEHFHVGLGHIHYLSLLFIFCKTEIKELLKQQKVKYTFGPPSLINVSISHLSFPITKMLPSDFHHCFNVVPSFKSI
jgi:hypothetical protein